MPKTREQKEQLLQDYNEGLKKAQAIILVDFSMVKSKDLFRLKDALYEKRIDFKVVKNKILNLALKDQKIEIPSEILDHPLGLAFSDKDEIEPAKIIYEFTKENDKLEILGGILNREFTDGGKITALAMLPSREELYFRFLGALNAPKFRLLNALTQNQNKLIYLLKTYLNQIGG